MPYSEWLAKLEDYNSQTELRLAAVSPAEETPRSLHALRLMPFYRSIANRVGCGPNAFGMATLNLKEALKISSTIADTRLRQLRMQDVRRWLTYWRKIGMLS